MNWFSNIFKAKTSDQIRVPRMHPGGYDEGFNAFEIGKKLWNDAVLNKSLSNDRKEQKIIASLEFLDQAIEKGYDEVDVFLLRGNVLRDLHYDFDALKDFNMCINKNPQKASYYYDRALTKESIYDYEGSLADFKEAIRLSKFDNDDTRYWNDYAQKTGYDSATQKYELDLKWLIADFKIFKERMEKNEEHYGKEYAERRANIKRRL